jgi:hypothetical protein
MITVIIILRLWLVQSSRLRRNCTSKTLSIRTRQNGDLGVLTIDEILPRLQEAIASKGLI